MQKEEKQEKEEKYNYHPITLKLKVLSELAINSRGLNELGRAYNLPVSTIYKWREKYSSEISLYKVLSLMSKKRQKTKEELEQENDRLAKALEEAMLKVVGLETMIDIAEEELRVSIRKKSGTKQSNK